MIGEFFKMMSYPFMSRAFIVGILVALCASLLGVSLVLKRYSMIGDGLSHVGFGALAVATAFSTVPMLFSIPAVLIAAFVMLRINEKHKMNGDAAVALISTGSLAVGVMVISFTSGANIDVYNYMFGSILALSRWDVILSSVLSGAILLLYVIFYSKIFSVTFDEDFSKASGTNAGLYNLIIAALTALTVVIGMKLVGTLLISALIIFPPLSAMKIFKSFKGVTVCSAVLSIMCFIIGIELSYFLSTPAGASVVCVNILAFAAFSVVGHLKNRFFTVSQRSK